MQTGLPIVIFKGIPLLVGVMNIYKQLVEHFGGQVHTAKKLNVEQGTVSGWCRGIHGMGAKAAIKAEIETGGKFKAADLCESLSELAAHHQGKPIPS